MIAFDGAAIIYRERPLPLWLRAFAVFLGVGLATVIPTPFIIHADWTVFSPVLVLAALCIVTPIALGAFFVFLGFVSATDLRLDPAAGVAERSLRGPIVNRKDRFSLSEISKPEVVMRDSEDGKFPILKLRLPRGRVEMACFDSEAEARAWCSQINLLLRKDGPRFHPPVDL